MPGIISRHVKMIIIIPHVKLPYKTSIDEQLIFSTITPCYSNGEYYHSFAIATGDSRKYQSVTVMLCNTNVRTVPSCQKMLNINGA